MIERDRTWLERISWPVFSAAQAESFRSWWETSLFFGAHWFSAAWPSPVGRVDVVRRFRGAPSWSFVPGGFWEVSALCEVRGRGEPPRLDPLPLFLLHFDGDLSDELGATYGPDGAGVSSPAFAASATGFGQQASFPAAGSYVARALYPSTQRFIDADEWQIDAFVTISTANDLTRTVIEIAGNDEAGSQVQLLWVTFADVGDVTDPGKIELGVRVRTDAATVASVTVVSTSASRIPPGQRTHVRVTGAGGLVRAYVNGTLSHSSPLTIFTAVPQPYKQVTIGAALAGFNLGSNVYSAFMRGLIDEVRFCQEVTDEGDFDPPTRPFTVPIS